MLYRDDAGDDGSQFSTVFNEENRHTPLNQTELLKFSTHVAKFSGKIAKSFIKKDKYCYENYKHYNCELLWFLESTCEVMLTREIYIYIYMYCSELF